ncbi:MAG: hypothetical protein BLITH_1506 [Brockia lithotrophica]|uniref:Uncharacterized protein n=1 Tax=Brockia lithotrophica TaxID=933949 RepID=A0A2T5G5G4_9BACL|nr:MAG: hypothetical protein BLITH_1506 [Brockia lithotrophica]
MRSKGHSQPPRESMRHKKASPSRVRGGSAVPRKSYTGR